MSRRYKPILLAVIVVVLAIVMWRYPALLGGQKTSVQIADPTAIAITNTDDNSDEDLIISSDKKVYEGFDGSKVYFTVDPLQKKSEHVGLQFYFTDSHAKVVHVYQYQKSAHYWSELQMNNGAILGDKYSVAMDRRKALEGKTYIGANASYDSKGEKQYFMAQIAYDSGTPGQFLIEGFGSEGSYGVLDPWYNSGWGYRKKITINPQYVASSTGITNFPMLFSRTDPDLRYTGSGGNVASSTGGEILFADEAGNKLSHEIEYYASTTGQLVAWVKVPFLSSTSTRDIYIYYGNATVPLANQQDKTNVWDSNYKGVWHLNQDPSIVGSGGFTDSTSNANNATDQGSFSSSDSITSGIVGPSLSFGGSNQYLSTANSISDPDTLTQELWFKTTSSGGYTMFQFNSTQTGEAYTDWDRTFFVGTDGKVNFGCYDGTTHLVTSSKAYNDGLWHMGVAEHEDVAGQLSLYVDGKLVGTSATGINCQAYTGYWRIGSWDGFAGASVDGYFNGQLDEVRTTQGALRSADWISTEYANQSSPNTFYSYDGQAVSIRATSVAGVTVRAGTGAATDWYNTSWPYRKKITVNPQYVGGGHGAETHVVFLTSGSSWTVPSDWVSSGSTIEVIGAGGGGSAQAIGGGQGGGGGGAYAKITNASLSPSASVSYSIGGGGAHDTGGGDTYFCNSSSNCGSIAGTAVIAGAKGGGGGSGRTGGTGGASGSSVGSTKYSGGNGGTTVNWAGGGGGGAAGPSGAGANGAADSNEGAGGGGGANGGSAGGTSGNGHDGGAGGASGASGGAGGTSGSPNGVAGSAGSGGGGGFGDTNVSNGNGGTGGAGSIYTQTSNNATAGPGGGGGGTGDWWGAAALPGTGGLYGGGGGGAADDGDTTTGAAGAQGIIVITYTSAAVSGGVSNFPMLFSRTDLDLKATVNGGHVASTTGGDILFTDSSGNKLSHEIEKYASTTGELIAWVNVPFLSSTSTRDFYIYYGNATVPLANQQNKTGTWDSNFKGVWHVPDGTTLAATDSTSNANNGSVTSVDATTGKIDGSALFNAAGDKVDLGTGLSLTGAYTISAWVKAINNPPGADDGQLLSQSTQSSVGYSMKTTKDSGNYTFGANMSSDGTGGTRIQATGLTKVANGQWYYVTSVYVPSTSYKLYVNGVDDHATVSGAVPAAVFSTANHTILGGDPTGGYDFDGSIDEARVSNVERSADWIQTEYNNQVSPNAFYSYSGEGIRQLSSATAGVQIRGGTGAATDWYNTSWPYRKKITVNPEYVGEGVSNFPMLFSRTDNDFKYTGSGGHFASSTAGEIVFTDSSGNKLSHEIEKYASTTGELVAWVKVPFLSSTSTRDFYIYYGNATVPLANQQNKTGAWDSNFKGVWHLPDGTTLSAVDSTGVNNGSISGAAATTTPIGGGAGFNSLSDKISVSDNNSLDLTTAGTLDAWVQINYLDGNNYVEWFEKYAGGSTPGYQVSMGSDSNGATLDMYNGTTYVSYHPSDTYFGSYIIGNGRLNHVVITWDGSNVRFYKNGSQFGNAVAMTTSAAAGTAALTLGTDTGWDGQVYGKLDEMRVSNTARSSGWILTEYNNGTLLSSFSSVSGEGTRTQSTGGVKFR